MDDLSALSTPSTTMPRNVSFAKVQVREYAQTFGDQPCASGPPLALGWDFNEVVLADVEEFEASREGNRRQGREMKMPAGIRVEKLREHGFSQTQIRKTTIESKRVMAGRRRTANQSEAQFMASMALESLGRKIKRVVPGGDCNKKDYLALNASALRASDLRASDPGLRQIQSMHDIGRMSSLPPRSILKTSELNLRKYLDTSDELIANKVVDYTTEDSDSETQSARLRGVPLVKPPVATATDEDSGFFIDDDTSSH
jgi:hypothetical protein